MAATVVGSLMAKRGRCLSSAAVAGLGLSLEFDPIDALQLIFPDADPQVLRDYFQASGNILDAAIRGFKGYLASGRAEQILLRPMLHPGTQETILSPLKLHLMCRQTTFPTNGSEWQS